MELFAATPKAALQHGWRGADIVPFPSDAVRDRPSEPLHAVDSADSHGRVSFFEPRQCEV